MKQILHITPHLGGGVGRVLLSHLDYALSHQEDRHAVACLDYANPAATARALAAGIPLGDCMARRIPQLIEAIRDVDLLVLHWWNHPLLYDLLVRERLPPARVLLWSHVSGHESPQNFTNALLSYPDLFVVASPYSFEAPAIARMDAAQRRERIRLVFSCGGIDHVRHARPTPHEGFRIGYVGTVDYCKMHPRFIPLSASAEIPSVRFVVCGGPSEAAIRKEAEADGWGQKFEFLGQVDDPAIQLSTFDLFGYPLIPGHYGTGEQALIEALAAGAPPVVLDNGPERHIVEDGLTGVIARDEKSYTKALESLSRNSDRRIAMSENARQSAARRFTIERTAAAWSELYEEALQRPKRPRSWPGLSGEGRTTTAAEVFIASLGEYCDHYASSFHSLEDETLRASDEAVAHMNGLFRAETRGSVFHYRSFFPDDPYLNFWCGLKRLADGERDEARRDFLIACRKKAPQRVERYMDCSMP